MDFLKNNIKRAVRRIQQGRARAAVRDAALASKADKGRPAQDLFVPPGHYYSPIVDPAELISARHMERAPFDRLLGVDLNEQGIMATFDRLARHFDEIDFPEAKAPTHRYYFQNDFYNYGDAMLLSAMVREFQPPRIIEVGSGFSSAVLLDTLDAMNAGQIKCTFIEPYPERLRLLLRTQDERRVEIIESPIQSVPLSIFEGLEAGSLLFFDTTHISRTGSDVNHEIFQILPRLKPGVIVHFHDVFDQFEYPASWVLKDNRSWNELYLLRAFLMFNQKVEIILFNDLIAHRYPQRLRAASEKAARNAGGGLWLRMT
jgi:hypothetical protein